MKLFCAQYPNDEEIRRRYFDISNGFITQTLYQNSLNLFALAVAGLCAVAPDLAAVISFDEKREVYALCQSSR
jgi:hypothetical protein